MFSSSVPVKKPGERYVKLDQFHITTCFLFGYTATNRNIVYEDCLNQEIKSARHYIVNEAHFSSENHSPYTKQLMDIAEAGIVSKQVETKITTPPPDLPNNLSTPPKLWSKMIDKILLDMHFQNSHHEPCLYVHKFTKDPV